MGLGFGTGGVAGEEVGVSPMLAVWVLRCDIRSWLELNLRPQKSLPCIQEHMNCDAPPTVSGRLVGGGAGAEAAVPLWGGGARR